MNYGAINEYILTGNVNAGGNGVNTSLYQKRDWSDYQNSEMGGDEATVLTKSRLDSWYSKYIEASANSNTGTTIQKIYSSPYFRYQNIVDNYSTYCLSQVTSGEYMFGFWPLERALVGMSGAGGVGLRILVTLKPEVMLSKESVGTKTLSGGHMDTYGGAQTYNIWNLGVAYDVEQEPERVDVVDPLWTVHKVEQNKETDTVTVTIDATDKFLDNSTLSLTDIVIKSTTTGETITNLQKSLSGPKELTYLEDGERKLYGHRYVLTLSGFEEEARRNGKLYKEWSGAATIEIAAGTAIDLDGNKNKIAPNLSLGFLDVIEPEYTYKYSESDIDKEEKTVKVEFIVADKFFKQSSLIDASQLEIKIDGETPIWKGENGNTTGVTRTLTKKTLAAEVTDANRVTYKTNGDIYYDIDGSGTSVKIGEKYVLTLSELEQDAITAGKKYLDYSGIVTIVIPAGVATDYFDNASNSQEITIGIDVIGDQGPGLPSTAYTKPYMPVGYKYLEGNLAEGLVIRHETNGNEFVWVEVPTNIYENASYNTETTTGDRKPDSSTDYADIEYCLNKYTNMYKGQVEYEDEFLSTDQYGFADANAYNEQKYKMLKSIFTYGGFYVGRYETGIEDVPRISGNASAEMPSEIPVIKKNAYPYNWVTGKQAQALASSNHFAVQGYETSLMFGVQWNLILKYMETKAVAGLSGEEYETKLATIQSELNYNSTNWGNYKSSNWTIDENADAKYYTYSGGWKNGLYNGGTKGNTDTMVLLLTGADKDFSKQNIYDIAGNVEEYTLQAGSINYKCVIRGGSCTDSTGYISRASAGGVTLETNVTYFNGFRVSLYKDADQDTGGNETGSILPSTSYTKPYMPEGYEYLEGNLANGLVIRHKTNGNEFVWVEVPTNIYENASYNTENTTADRKPDSSTDYADIEYCLQQYSATYRLRNK